MTATATLSPDAARLADAFRLFSQASGHLEDAWARLQGQVDRLQSELADTSAERDAARDAAGDSARQLACLLDALPAGVVLRDTSGRILRINEAARAILGTPPAGADWHDVLDQLVGRDGDRASSDRPAVARDGAGGDLTIADGRRLRICERPMPSGDRILLITDITSQRKLEDVLARHRRLAALGEMAATLAHQIRTPLSAALLYTDNAAHPAVSAPRRTELLGRATDCLHDLEQLVSDMLGFERGAGRPDTPVDLHDIVVAVETAARPLLRPGQSFAVRTATPPVVITCNRESLSGALLNLVSNALQAGGRNACVTMDVRQRAGQVDIRVSDNGPGVPAALRERIFEPFFTSRSDGTGLGLAVVRSVAEAHGGSVRVEDQDGTGACFAFSVPAAGARTSPATAEALA